MRYLPLLLFIMLFIPARSQMIFNDEPSNSELIFYDADENRMVEDLEESENSSRKELRAAIYKHKDNWQMKSFGITTGINYTSIYTFDIGLGMARYGILQQKGFFHNYYVGAELSEYAGSFIFAPKASYWMNADKEGWAFGATTIYYTDFDTGSLKLRPEIGFGFGNMKLVYGYNIPLVNRNFSAIGGHCINFVFYIEVAKLKYKRL